MNMKPIVELKDICKSYGKGEHLVHALRDASLAVYPGEVLLIQGPSGSGKTTLLSILGLVLSATSGSIRIEDRLLDGLRERDLPPLRARTFGFVFQAFNLFPALTALENVALAMQMKADLAPRQAFTEAERLLDVVGLRERMHHLPADLSGGQKQRVAIARALGGTPKVILGDEPTAALDTNTGIGIMNLLRDLAKKRGRAVVIVTHDHRLDGYADRIVSVEDGRVGAAIMREVA
jgi:putative ABC transport system ATP-binding protein